MKKENYNVRLKNVLFKSFLTYSLLLHSLYVTCINLSNIKKMRFEMQVFKLTAKLLGIHCKFQLTRNI